MGEYRVKSGQSLPSLGDSLPNLPKIGALQKKSIAPAPLSKSSPSSSSIPIPKLENRASIPRLNTAGLKSSDKDVKKSPEAAQEKSGDIKSADELLHSGNDADFELADDMPTEVGSTDDLLAAMNGIDGLDDVSSVGNRKDLNLDAPHPSSELLGEDDLDEPTMVQSASMLDVLDSGLEISGLKPVPKEASKSSLPTPPIPHPSSASVAKAPSVSALPKTPSIASVPKFSTPHASVPGATPSGTDGAQVQDVSSSPQEEVASSGISESSCDDSAPENAQGMASESTPNATELETPTQAGEASSSELPHTEEASAPELPSSQSTKSDAIGDKSEKSRETPQNNELNAQQFENVEQSSNFLEESEENMSDEEQFQAILNSMTPEERMAYETHAYEEQVKEAQLRRERQKQLMEMYGNSPQERSGMPKWLIAVMILVVLGLFGGIYAVTQSEPEPVAEEGSAEKVVEEPVAAERVELKTYPVTVEISGAMTLYVNGVEKPMGQVDFVEGHMNTVMAFAPGMVPYFKTFPSDSKVAEKIEAKMEPDTLYEKGRIEFRMTDASQSLMRYTARLDGQPLMDFPKSVVSDVVLGRPHILTIETPELAKHMHIIWPDDRNMTVTLPELRTRDSALLGTESMMSKFPTSDKPYSMLIVTGKSRKNSPVVSTVLPGDMIEYSVSREQRETLKVAIIPDGYGTLGLDASLLRNSIGESVVSFRRTDKNADYRVCMRRVGVVICPSMTEDSTVPSGLDWEFFGVTGSETNPVMMRGIQIQLLQSSRKYIFETSTGKGNTFKYRQVGFEKIKKK